MDRRILILSASIGSGHNSAAAALEASVKNRIGVSQVRTIDVLETTPEVYRTFYDDAYFSLVEAVPWLVGWGYDAGDRPFKLGGTISLWDRMNTTQTVRQIRDYMPDIVFCTHFLPVRLVSLMRTRGDLTARLAVVTTDYDFQGLWLSNTFNSFFVAREETRAYLIELGLPADRLATTGIPVRAEFSRPFDADAVRQRHGLHPDLPTLLISAGAAGGSYAAMIVRQVLALRQSFQAVVVCGHNTELRAEITQLTAGDERFRVLGYTQEMPGLMRVATLFVGKPGGLSASECMAAGLPMVLIKPIPGQEERNSDYLLEEGAAVRCNYDSTIGWKIGSLLADPARLALLAAGARRVGRATAADEIVSSVLADDREPLWISHAAQRSILATSKGGRPPTDLEPDRQIRTLVDRESGRSVGLITEAQRRLAAKVSAGKWIQAVADDSTLTVSRARLSLLRRGRIDPFLLLTLRNILDLRYEASFDVRAPAETASIDLVEPRSRHR